MLRPTDCIDADFDTRWCRRWARLMGMGGAHHSKIWESAALVEALRSRGCLKRGKVGLGMGVGSEPLAAVFASLGVEVLATDQSPEDEHASRVWNNGQLASGADALFYDSILDRATFDARVSYAAFNMNEDDPAFHDRFDFVWHNCVIGHLGSMKSAIEHLERSADYLVDGGWLVFTTELNVASDVSTIDADSDTVLWRLSDLESLQETLSARGLVADPLRLRLGSAERDLRISGPLDEGVIVDYVSRAGIDTDIMKMTLGGYAITQILMAFQKRGTARARDRRAWERASVENRRALDGFAKQSRDTAEYYADFTMEDIPSVGLRPKRRKIELTAEPGSLTTVTARYRNRGSFSLFDYSVITPFNRPPLVLATSDPINRESALATHAWHSPNRPAVQFTRSESTAEHRAWGHHVAGPGHWFEFTIELRAPLAPGPYTEQFIAVFEGVGAIPDSWFDVVVTVPEQTAVDPGRPSAP